MTCKNCSPIETLLEWLENNEDAMHSFKAIFIDTLLEYKAEVVEHDDLGEEDSKMAEPQFNRSKWRQYGFEEFHNVISLESKIFDKFLLALSEDMDE